MNRKQRGWTMRVIVFPLAIVVVGRMLHEHSIALTLQSPTTRNTASPSTHDTAGFGMIHLKQRWLVRCQVNGDRAPLCQL